MTSRETAGCFTQQACLPFREFATENACFRSAKLRSRVAEGLPTGGTTPRHASRTRTHHFPYTGGNRPTQEP